jgi:superfamily II DNA or RNA helicase
MPDDNKTIEQEIVKSKIRNNNYRGTYIGATGVGKTKIGVDLIVENLISNPNEKWLVITPTENLRDNEWALEFIKWGYSQYLSKVQIICIQTAYKIAGQEFNAVVDEVHTTISPEYKMFYLNNKINKLICFTATIDDQDKKLFINDIAPILHTTDMNRARELEIVAPYFIFNYGIQLSEKSQNKYDDIMQLYNKYESSLGGPLRAFGTSSYVLKNIRPIPKEERTEGQNALFHKATMYWVMMNKRKSFLYDCPEKIEATMEILKKFPEKKALVFSEAISFAKKLYDEIPDECVLFHSRMSKPERKKSLLAFEIQSNKIRVISAVKALNAGFNVPECSLAICASGNSKWLDMVQRQGRISRKQDDKLALFFNLYILGTQDIKWVASRTKTINQKYVKWITKLEEVMI